MATDARFIDPTLVLDTTQRTTFLSEFDGLSPQGKWVLFLAGMEYRQHKHPEQLGPSNRRHSQSGALHHLDQTGGHYLRHTP